jgi:hypothetical protein
VPIRRVVGLLGAGRCLELLRLLEADQVGFVLVDVSLRSRDPHRSLLLCEVLPYRVRGRQRLDPEPRLSCVSRDAGDLTRLSKQNQGRVGGGPALACSGQKPIAIPEGRQGGIPSRVVQKDRARAQGAQVVHRPEKAVVGRVVRRHAETGDERTDLRQE